jgi:hypothetical protein
MTIGKKSVKGKLKPRKDRPLYETRDLCVIKIKIEGPICKIVEV